MTKLLHTPVMVKQVTAALSPTPTKIFLDATLGFGGHSLALLEQGSTVVALDRDPEMLEAASSRIATLGYSSRFHPLRGSFASLLSSTLLPYPQYDGILFDLGVSSYQLDTPRRGFSFRFDSQLDMRMDPGLGVTASDLVNALSKSELVKLFKTLGEENFALKIAEKILDQRQLSPITSTKKLADLVSSVVPKTKAIHPATKVFQALRMAVNSEREELEAALPSALSLLAPHGILAVITFHSLEDKIVERYLPVNPLTPTAAEVRHNPRSRSAKLYVYSKDQS